MAKNSNMGKRPKKPVAPKSVPLELSPHYRTVYSERQFTRVEGDNFIIGFLSSDRRYSGSSLEALPDGRGLVPSELMDETGIEVHEVTVKMPILRAIGLGELIAASIRSLSPERLKDLGIEIKPLN